MPEYEKEQEEIEIHKDPIEVETFGSITDEKNTLHNPNISGGSIRGASLHAGKDEKILEFDPGVGLWMGNSSFSSAPFRVDMDGNVVADSIKITASSGSEVDWSYIANVAVKNIDIDESLTVSNTDADVTSDQFSNTLANIDQGTTRANGGLSASYQITKGFVESDLSSESAPTDGVKIDSSGIYGYSGGSASFYINSSGDAYFEGNIGASTVDATFDVYDENYINFYNDTGSTLEGRIFANGTDNWLQVTAFNTLNLQFDSAGKISFRESGAGGGASSEIDANHALIAYYNIEMNGYDIDNVENIISNSSDAYLEDSAGNTRTINNIVTSSGGDNLGNHTATQDLDMSNYDVTNTNKVYTDYLGADDNTDLTITDNLDLQGAFDLKNINAIYVDTINVDAASDISVNESLDLQGSYYIKNSAEVQTNTVADNTGDTVFDISDIGDAEPSSSTSWQRMDVRADVIPYANESGQLGYSTQAWDRLYANSIFSSDGTVGSYQTHEDIDLIKNIGEKKQKGKRDSWNLSDLPSEIEDSGMVNVAQLSGLLIGTFKQLIEKVETLEKEVETLK